MENKDHKEATTDTTTREETAAASPVEAIPGSIPTLPNSYDVETPRTDSQPSQIDPLSNLAASSANTVEINAKLAMSANSHNTSLGDLASNNNNNHLNGEEQPLIRELPAFHAQKPLKPSPAGEELKQQQLQRIQELEKGKLRAAPQCAGPTEEDSRQQQKLHISTSTISLAFSTALSTPADTPLTPGDDVKMPHKRQRSLSIQQTEAILMGSDSDDEEEGKPAAAKKNRVEKGQDAMPSTTSGLNGEEEEKKEEFGSGTIKEATWSVRQNLGPRGPEQRWRGKPKLPCFTL